MPKIVSFEQKTEAAKQQAEQGANRVQGLVHWFTWMLDGGRQEQIIEVLRVRLASKANPEFTLQEVDIFMQALAKLAGPVDDRIHACWPDAPRHFNNNDELMVYVRQVHRPVIVVVPDAENPNQTTMLRVRPDGKFDELMLRPH